MGVNSLQEKPGFYGLSAAIGGLEISPLELTGVYATLANNGTYRGLRIFKDEAAVPGGVTKSYLLGRRI